MFNFSKPAGRGVLSDLAIINVVFIFLNIRVVRHDRYQARVFVDREYYEQLYKDDLQCVLMWLKRLPLRDILIGLFANDVIIIGSVPADWPAPFSVTIGNPRADKRGRNGFECIVLRCSVDRERCVRATFMNSAIENYSTCVYYASLTTMVGVSRNTKIRNVIDFHGYLA